MTPLLSLPIAYPTTSPPSTLAEDEMDFYGDRLGGGWLVQNLASACFSRLLLEGSTYLVVVHRLWNMMSFRNLLNFHFVTVRYCLDIMYIDSFQ